MSKLPANMPPILRRLATPRAFYLWHKYVDAFEEQFGLDEVVCDYLGAVGAKVGVAEFKVKGPTYYESSIVAPVRNAWYNAAFIERRWERLRQLPLTPPILDYGCGVGFTLMWMAEHGYEPAALYGWDVPGPQRRIAQSVLGEEGIQWWDEATPATFGTIICLNVLEHLPAPMDTLSRLRSMTTNLIANCDADVEGDHSTPPETRAAVRLDLERAGQLFATEDPP